MRLIPCRPFGKPEASGDLLDEGISRNKIHESRVTYVKLNCFCIRSHSYRVVMPL